MWSFYLINKRKKKLSCFSIVQSFDTCTRKMIEKISSRLIFKNKCFQQSENTSPACLSLLEKNIHILHLIYGHTTWSLWQFKFNPKCLLSLGSVILAQHIKKGKLNLI